MQTVRLRPVHPHTCGEHKRGQNGHKLKNGSSPPYVGNTNSFQGVYIANPVHPHTWGEHVDQVQLAITTLGSSPRGWGTLRVNASFQFAKRLIPTRVGNTRFPANVIEFLSAHPHACGEHSRTHVHSDYKNGSSPRVWGTHRCRERTTTNYRLIPTCVGNTPVGSSSSSKSTGSSPHAWGTLQ